MNTYIIHQKIKTVKTLWIKKESYLRILFQISILFHLLGHLVGKIFHYFFNAFA
jgi:hypothetical protein